MNKIWESLSPDSILNRYNQDYWWLTSVYQSVRPSTDDIGKLLWHTLGAKTTELIHKNVHVDGIHDDLSEYILDADVIEEIFNNPDEKQVKKLEKVLIRRFKKHGNNPRFKELSERLVQKELRKKLLKYKLHKDQVLFERAYGYIKEYY